MQFFFIYFRIVKPDDGCLEQPKHVALWLTIIKCCVRTTVLIAMYCINTTGMIHIFLVHPRTGHEAPAREWMYSSTLSSTSALDSGGWSTPGPGRFTRRERPGTNCIGGWVGPWADLDGSGKSRPRPHRDSIPRPSTLKTSRYTDPRMTHIKTVNLSWFACRLYWAS